MLAILGKTASGKTTLVNELVNNFGFKQIVTYTTRPIREGEIPDVTYHYISAEEFEEKKSEGFFAETASYWPAQGGIWSYGTALEDIEEADDNTVIIINPKGLRSLSEKGYSKNITSLYLMVRDDVLIDRLKERGDSPDEANRRLEADEVHFFLLENEVDFWIRNEPYWTIPEIAKIITNFLYVENAFREGAVDYKTEDEGEKKMFKLRDLADYLKESVKSPVKCVFRDKGKTMDLYVSNGDGYGDVHIGTIDENFNVRTEGCSFPLGSVLHMYTEDVDNPSSESILCSVLFSLICGVKEEQKVLDAKLDFLNEIIENKNLDVYDEEYTEW